MERFEITDHVREHPAFKVDLAYRYQWNGKEYQGSHLWADKNADSNYEFISAARERLRGDWKVTSFDGTSGECLVNANSPNESVLLLDRDFSWGGTVATLVFFVGFTTIGIGLLCMEIDHRRGKKKKQKFRPIRPKERIHTRGGAIVVYSVLSFFFIAGMGLLYLAFEPSISRIDSWTTTEAKVIWERNSGLRSPQTHPWAEVYYRYEFRGREYHSNGQIPVRFIRKSPTEIEESSSEATFTCLVKNSEPWIARVAGADPSFHPEALVLGSIIVAMAGLLWVMAFRERTARQKKP